MDIIAIKEAIEELENGDTSPDNVSELASLYIVYENLKTALKTMVEREYDDILPAYKQYCTTKRRYQLGEITEGAVIKDLKLVCTEIREFVSTIYKNTDMNRERNILTETLETLVNTYKTT